MCSKKIKDKRTLNEYFVEIDTCNQFSEYTHHAYFRNDGIFMAGYGDRLIKQGKWNYYYKKEKVAEGMFKDGIPFGNWKYKYLDDATWKVVKSKEDNFEVSIPSSWIQEDYNPNFSLFTYINSENKNEANFNIVVSNYDLKVSEYLTKHIDTLRTNTLITEIDVKELKIEGVDEAFQRKFKIQKGQYSELVFQTFYGRKDIDKVFIITINSKYTSYREYEPIFEPMLNSFRMY